jgi:hypothetical protein
MHRRDFLTTGAAALAFSSFPFAEQFADTHKRVGLIGAGWYGKTDLLRLVQVAQRANRCLRRLFTRYRARPEAPGLEANKKH